MARRDRHRWRLFAAFVEAQRAALGEDAAGGNVDQVGQPALDGDQRRARRFVGVEDRSPALAARRLVIAEELGDALLETIAHEVGRPADDLALRCLRGALVATLGLRDRVVRTGLREGASAPELRTRVVAAVDEAFRRLRAAYADVDPPRA